MSGTQDVDMQSEIPSLESDAAQKAWQARKENLKINRRLKMALNSVRTEFLKNYPTMVLIGVGKDYLIEKKESNFDFYIKIVRLIIANDDKHTTNTSITFEAQKSFPDEAINKNIWSKKLSSKMKKSLNIGLKEDLVKLLSKAATLTEFKKMVISSAQLKSGNTVYKPAIEISDLVMSVNGVPFPIQKNSTTKDSKKHEYAQIRANLGVFLNALKLKKQYKKKV